MSAARNACPRAVAPASQHHAAHRPVPWPAAPYNDVLQILVAAAGAVSKLGAHGTFRALRALVHADRFVGVPLRRVSTARHSTAQHGTARLSLKLNSHARRTAEQELQTFASHWAVKWAMAAAQPHHRSTVPKCLLSKTLGLSLAGACISALAGACINAYQRGAGWLGPALALHTLRLLRRVHRAAPLYPVRWQLRRAAGMARGPVDPRLAYAGAARRCHHHQICSLLY